MATSAVLIGQLRASLSLLQNVNKNLNAETKSLYQEKIALQKAHRALEKTYQKRVECSIAWGVRDFLDYELDGWEITKKQAEAALKQMIHDHDACYGISWDTVACYYEQYGTEIKD